MRNGPKPLPFQLGMASMAAAGMAGGTVFDAQTLQAFFSGIQKYQKHTFKRNVPALPVVWRGGEAQLYHAKAEGMDVHKTPVFLVPSMINKSDILDLLPDRSLLRWLSSQGFDVYLFDWGQPVEDADQKSLDTAILNRLVPAIGAVGGPVLLMGYCMGGLLSAAVSTLRPDLIRGLLLLATPWNFHDEKGALKARLSLMKPMALPYMKQHNHLPESWMQAVFATLDPESSIRKFASFARMEDGDGKEKIFVAVEDWLNDGIHLPADIATTCMDEWYEQNTPFLGEWVVGGQKIRAQDIKVPTFVMAARDDKIVPMDSALGFADLRTKCDRLVCPTGHVGLIAGNKVVEQVWKPMADWFATQQ